MSSRTPYEILNVDESTSREEVVAAYHALAQLYHPDKTVNLAPEIQVLAEHRMKEINLAYRELLKSFEIETKS
jgi:DnaJ-class molecular chaperone